MGYGAGKSPMAERVNRKFFKSFGSRAPYIVCWRVDVFLPDLRIRMFWLDPEFLEHGSWFDTGAFIYYISGRFTVCYSDWHDSCQFFCLANSLFVNNFACFSLFYKFYPTLKMKTTTTKKDKAGRNILKVRVIYTKEE